MCLFCKDFSIYKCFPKYFNAVREKIGEKCPTIYCVLFDNVNKWRILRYTFGYIFGLFIAFVFWDIFIVDLGFPFDLTYDILFALLVILGIGYAFSVKIRCIVFLSILGFLGKTGRSFIRAMVFALIIAGPVTNLALNGKEVIRVFACSTILTYNLTKNRFDLMSKPFMNAVIGMKENISEIKKTFGEVQQVVAPVISEIETQDVPEDETIHGETLNSRNMLINNLPSFKNVYRNNEDINANYIKTGKLPVNTFKNHLSYSSLLLRPLRVHNIKSSNKAFLNSVNQEKLNLLHNINKVNEQTKYGSYIETIRIKRNIFDPQNESVEDAEIYQQRYINKMRKRCQLQLKKGEDKCKGAFEKAYNDCYKKLPSIVNTLLCWPMKITAVCNLELIGFSKGEHGICDPTKVIDRDLGENFIDLKSTRDTFMSNLSSTRVDYSVINPKNVPGVRSAEETGKAVINEFSQKKSLFDKYMYIVKRLLSFIFLKIIIGSVKYHNKYLRNIEHDNIYITNYFKKIDNRRKERGQNTLLPLKKVESTGIVDPTEARKSKQESKSMSAHFLKLIIEIITTLIFLLLDYIIYTLMGIVAKNARIEYRQEGEHTVQVMVNGSGIIANLMKTTLRGFNINESISTILTNEPCLPQPRRLSNWFYTKIGTMELVLIILVCNETLLLRMRRIICSYFYPKREKCRILHLYNKLLKRRKTVFKVMYITIKERVLKDQLKIRFNILTSIRVRCPILFGWLRNFKFARRKCIICEEPEPRKYDKTRPYNFAKCKTWGCYAVHCDECWFEVGRICLACHKLPKSERSEIGQDEFDSDFSEV